MVFAEVSSAATAAAAVHECDESLEQRIERACTSDHRSSTGLKAWPFRFLARAPLPLGRLQLTGLQPPLPPHMSHSQPTHFQQHYSLFGGHQYPLDSVQRLLAQSAVPAAAAAGLHKPSVQHSSAAIKPPPGFESVIPQKQLPVLMKEALEEKKVAEPASSVASAPAVSSLFIALPARADSPTGDSASLSPSSSVGSSASSSAASSRKGSFSFGSEKSSPLLSAALPPLPQSSGMSIRVLSPIATAPPPPPAAGRASNRRGGNGRRRRDRQ